MNKNTHRFRRKGIGLLISGEGKRLLRFGSQLRAQGSYNFFIVSRFDKFISI